MYVGVEGTTDDGEGKESCAYLSTMIELPSP